MVEKHIKKDNKSSIFKHLLSTATCCNLYSSLSFKSIDKANSKFNLKIEEGLHINWRKPKTKQNRKAKSFSPHPFDIAYVTLCPFLAFLFHLLFSLSVTLIIANLYCFNHTSLSLHMITTHLVSHVSLSSNVFILSTLIVVIFHFLNYTSLLLYLISTYLVSHLPFWSLIFIITTLIIVTFYFLNYTSLLLYLIIAHLVNTFCN